MTKRSQRDPLRLMRRRGWELLGVMRDEIERVGGEVEKVRYGRHVIVFWRLGAAKHINVCGGTASDWRAALNVRGEVRRKAS